MLTHQHIATSTQKAKKVNITRLTTSPTSIDWKIFQAAEHEFYFEKRICNKIRALSISYFVNAKKFFLDQNEEYVFLENLTQHALKFLLNCNPFRLDINDVFKSCLARFLHQECTVDFIVSSIRSFVVLFAVSFSNI